MLNHIQWYILGISFVWLNSTHSKYPPPKKKILALDFGGVPVIYCCIIPSPSDLEQLFFLLYLTYLWGEIQAQLEWVCLLLCSGIRSLLVVLVFMSHTGWSEDSITGMSGTLAEWRLGCTGAQIVYIHGLYSTKAQSWLDFLHGGTGLQERVCQRTKQ